MRRLLIGLLACVLVILGASLLIWRGAVGRMQAELTAWEAAQRAQGWTIAHGPPEPGGWPLAAQVTLPDLTISGAADLLPRGVAWGAQRVTLRVSLLQPAVAAVQIGGGQRLRLGANAPVPYTAERCSLTLPLAAPDSAALDAAGVRLAGGTEIGLLQGQFDWHDRAAPRVRLTAEAITLPPPPAPQAALGSHIASATIEASLAGGVPQARDPQAAAAAWQAHGGAVAIRRLAFGWGPLGVTGSGALALDAALQPEGKAELRLVGYDATLAALAQANVLAPAAAQAAQAVLGLLASAPAGGGAPQVVVPLTLQGGRLSMGRIPLARLPHLDWPGAVQPAKLGP